MADLAVMMSWSLPQTLRGNDARAKALAIRGNVHRIQGDYRQAESLLTEALRLWGAGTGCHKLGTLICEFRASLYESTRQFGLALSALDAASAHSSAAGMDQAKIALQRAIVWAYQGRLEEAIHHCIVAARESRDVNLVRAATLSAAWCYTEAADPLGASDLLFRARGFVAAGPVGIGRKVSWIEARIADLQGSTAGAEVLYRTARCALTQGRRPHDAALVSLDLALLYLRMGHVAQSMAASSEAGVLLQAMGGELEAIAAGILCRITEDRLEEALGRCAEMLFPIRTAMLGRGHGGSAPPAIH